MSQTTTEQDKEVEVKIEGQEQAEEQESLLTLQLKLNDKLEEYFQNKAIASEANERNEIIKDEVREFFEKIGGMEHIAELKLGTYAKVKENIRLKNKLDVDALAQELQVSKDELKTPFDFSMFTKQGKLTPDMVSKYSDDVITRSLSITRLKKKPKKKKDSQR